MTTASRALLARLERAFEQRRNPRRAEGTAAYMLGQFTYLGLSLAELDAVMRDATRDLATPSERDVLDFARECWRRAEREYCYAALRYLRRHESVLRPRSLSTLKGLIITRSWWDTVDELAINVVGPLVRGNLELVRTMDEWIDSDNFWLARTAILHQNRYKEDTDAERLFRYCSHRAGDTEFFIRKAIGWALREYAKTDPRAVNRFVRANEERLSGLSKREALKHIG